MLIKSRGFLYGGSARKAEVLVSLKERLQLGNMGDSRKEIAEYGSVLDCNRGALRSVGL